MAVPPRPPPRVTSLAGAGYVQLSWWKFLLGLAVVSAPLVILERSSERWAWRYAALILLMLLVFHWQGLAAFARYLQAQLAGGVK